MICPFCRETEVGDYIGPTICPACNAGHEIEDRGECVFVNTDDPRMPMFSQACMQCGLVQQDKRETCIYCGTAFNRTVQLKNADVLPGFA